MSRFTPFRTLAVFAAVALAACSDAPPAGPDVAAQPQAAESSLSRSIVTEPADGPWSRIVEGTTGPGALYALYVPRDWNGDAVFYAHGFRDAESPVDLRDQDGLNTVRDQLGAMGYAVAYSSFSRNGFAVKDGAQRTHQLRGLLAAALGGQPARSFLAGHSLGGGIALSLAERYPDQYDGALLMCGMVGGSLVQTQYLGHVKALADAFFPGAFPGTVEGVPEGTVITIPQVAAAVQSNPAGLFAIASSAQAPLPFVPMGSLFDPGSTAFQTLVGSLWAGLSFHARGINDIVELTPGSSPFDNAGTVYALSSAPLLPPAALTQAMAFANANVTRYSADIQSANYLQRHFTPTGELGMPVLTIHNRWDPAVPRARATAAGATGNLLQRVENSYGHCAIAPATVVQAFADLTQWSATGTRPAN
jgi:pimeloyl-ACP methyl ester carboxylesterase